MIDVCHQNLSISEESLINSFRSKLFCPGAPLFVWRVQFCNLWKIEKCLLTPMPLFPYLFCWRLCVTLTSVGYSCKAYKMNDISLIIVFWKEMSVRFAASKDLHGSMLFKKTIVNPKGFLSWGNGPRKKFMIGIGISRYNLSGLLNQEKALKLDFILHNPTLHVLFFELTQSHLFWVTKMLYFISYGYTHPDT